MLACLLCPAELFQRAWLSSLENTFSQLLNVGIRFGAPLVVVPDFPCSIFGLGTNGAYFVLGAAGAGPGLSAGPVVATGARPAGAPKAQGTRDPNSKFSDEEVSKLHAENNERTPTDVSEEFHGITMQISCSSKSRAVFNKPTGTGRTATRSSSTDGTKHAP